MGVLQLQTGKLLVRGGLLAMDAACCCTPPVYHCADCEIFYGTIEFGVTWASFFANNTEIPLSEVISNTVVSRVIVEITDDVNDLLSQALVCHCVEQDFSCSLVCDGPVLGDPGLLYALFCDHLVYNGSPPYKFICGGTCLSYGPDATHPNAPYNYGDGDPCIYGDTTGYGSIPGTCFQVDSTITVADECCKKFKRAWELLLGGDDGIPDDHLPVGAPHGDGYPDDGDQGSHENCTWEIVAFNKCNFPDVHYDINYHDDLPIQLCQVHGGDMRIIAFVTRNWYPSSLATVAPSSQLYWWVILYIKANNMRHAALYQSPALVDIVDADNVTCARSQGIFQMTKVRELYYNDYYPLSIYEVKTCDFPLHIYLTAI